MAPRLPKASPASAALRLLLGLLPLSNILRVSSAEFDMDIGGFGQVHLQDGDENNGASEGPNLCHIPPEKCYNGGKCSYHKLTNTTNCFCQCGYKGVQCEIPPNTCELGNSTACGSRGECLASTVKGCGNLSRCKCEDHYIGDYCEYDRSACFNDNLKCTGNGECDFRKTHDQFQFYCKCNPTFSGKLCEISGTKTEVMSKWGWTMTAILITGLIAAAVVLERIWTCGKRTILRLQGREGFRRVPGDDEEYIDRNRQLDEFGDVEIEMIGSEEMNPEHDTK